MFLADSMFKLILLLAPIFSATQTLTLNAISCDSTATDEWSKYTCDIVGNVEKYQRTCIPRRYLPFNVSMPIASAAAELPAGKLIKGIVVMFHGYTACPDSFDLISLQLQDQGYLVLTPLLPGQGLNFNYGCSVKGACTKDGSNPSEVPSNKKGYTDWTAVVLRMVHEQLHLIPTNMRHPDFKVNTVGLSVGAALAVLAAEQADFDFDNVIVVNPLWANTAPVLDFNVKYCNEQKDPKECIMTQLGKVFPSGKNGTEVPPVDHHSGPFWKVWHAVGSFENSVKAWLAKETIGWALSNNYDNTLLALWYEMAKIGENSLLQRLPLLDNEYGWGQPCLNQVKYGRGGICTTRLKHLFALQSLTSYVVGELGQYLKEYGGARDSISYAITNALGGSRCHFQLVCSPDDIAISSGTKNNNCGTPHSIFSRPENELTPPNNLYWEQALFSTIFQEFEAKETDFKIGLPPAPVSSTDKVNPAVCVSTDQTIGWGYKFENLGIRFITQAIKMYGHGQ